MNEFVILAADTSAHAPGWGKLGALLLTGGAFLLVMKVWERAKARKNGEVVDPFSREAEFGTQPEESQVSAPVEPTKEGAERGPKRGFKFPWKGGK